MFTYITSLWFRRGFVAVILSWIAGLTAVGICSADESTPRPNILFILTDDQRWDTIHAARQQRNKNT